MLGEDVSCLNRMQTHNSWSQRERERKQEKDEEERSVVVVLCYSKLKAGQTVTS